MQKDLRKYAGTDYLQVLNNQIILPTSYFGPIPYYSILVNSNNYIFEKTKTLLSRQLEIGALYTVQQKIKFINSSN